MRWQKGRKVGDGQHKDLVACKNKFCDSHPKICSEAKENYHILNKTTTDMLTWKGESLMKSFPRERTRGNPEIHIIYSHF